MSQVHRSESFTSDGPVRTSIRSRSGDITVVTHAGTDVRVTFEASGANAASILEQAVISFDAVHGALEVRTQPSESFTFDSLKGLKDFVKKRSWFDLANSDPNIVLDLPEGSSVEIATGSGDSDLRGSFDTVEISSGSGDIKAGDTIDSLDIKTGSGDVSTGHVVSRLVCRCASGDVRCSGTANDTTIHTASGDVDLRATRAGSVAVRAVSGDVTIKVSRGLAVDVNGTSVSGDLGSAIPLDGDGGADDSETVAINVSTVSGDLRIDRAS